MTQKLEYLVHLKTRVQFLVPNVVNHNSLLTPVLGESNVLLWTWGTPNMHLVLRNKYRQTHKNYATKRKLF